MTLSGLPSTLLALAALLCVNSMSAQQLLLPYNPDENADGLIGVADLQGLLALYNTEFSAAVVSEDGEDAIVYVGDMAYPVCAQSCKALPGMWHLPTIEDLGLVWDDLFQGVTQTWVNEFDRVQNTLSTSSSVPAAVYFSTSTSYPAIRGSSLGDNSYRCYCAATEIPKIDCKVVQATSTDNLETAVSALVVDGWQLAPCAPSTGSSGFFQAPWRFAQ